MKNKEEYIKSPLNYTGGKYKLLPQILPLFPENINTFVDLFCGGLNVGVNVNSKKLIANDICTPVIDIFRGIKKEGSEDSLKKIEENVIKYELSKENLEGFLEIRKQYNLGNKSWDVFYTMLVHAFNYQIRFNTKGEYNMPFGKNKSSFNPRLKRNFMKFSEALCNLDVDFSDKSFEQFDTSNLTENDFVYVDPPYLISQASYNEREGWNIEKEENLLAFLDDLNEKGIKFGLSNVLEHKGLENTILKKWAEKYNIHFLNYNYKNCSYQGKNTGNKTLEVFITNY